MVIVGGAELRLICIFSPCLKECKEDPVGYATFHSYEIYNKIPVVVSKI